MVNIKKGIFTLEFLGTFKSTIDDITVSNVINNFVSIVIVSNANKDLVIAGLALSVFNILMIFLLYFPTMKTKMKDYMSILQKRLFQKKIINKWCKK